MIKSKAISTPIGILIVVICAILAGGIFVWQWQGWKEVKPPEIIKPEKEETADWKTYENEEYGFEFKYPKEKQVSFYQDTADFSYCIEEMPFTCCGYFWVRVWDNPSQLSLKDFVFEKYGKPIGSEEFVKDFVLNQTKGIQITKELRLPPGGGPMRNAIFLPRNLKVYEIAHSPDYEFMGGNSEDVEKCVEELDKIFNQMLSTFKFIE